MRLKHIAIYAAAGVASGNATAQPVADGPNPVLWGDLRANDRPEDVASKLSSNPEIKATKVKPGKPGKPGKPDKEPEVSISYTKDGIAILDDVYSVTPTFGSGMLRLVQLETGSTCENDASARFFRLLGVLRQKYPSDLIAGQPRLTPSDLSQAMLNVLNGLQGNASTALTNGNTAVLLTVSFYRIQPPSVSYGTGLAAALNNLSWTIYRNQAAQCGGTGASRAVFHLTYATDETMRAAIDRINQQENGARSEAASKL